MKKIILPVIAILILFIIIYAGNLPFDNKITVSFDKNWKKAQYPYSNSVVCTLKISAVTDFEEDHISGEVSIDKKSHNTCFC